MTIRRKFAKEFKSEVVLERTQGKRNFRRFSEEIWVTTETNFFKEKQMMSDFSNLFSQNNKKDKEEDVEIQPLYA